MHFERKGLEAEFRQMIGRLCAACAPSGFEDEAYELVRTLLPTGFIT